MEMSETTNFGEAVKRLEEIVKQLEQDEVALEESSELFEEGVKLAKLCSDRLHQAEKKIERLTKDGTGHLTSGTGESINE